MLKNKQIVNQTSEKFAHIAEQAGLLLMTIAAVTGMLELPSRPNNRIIVPNRPALALAQDNGDFSNPLRREREEESPLYDLSYSVTQRTPSRAAKK